MNVSVFVSTFLAASIEVIEMVAIIVAVGVTRQWRGALAGTLAGLFVLAVLIAALGASLQSVPLTLVRLVVGALLLVFGLQWLRKGVLRVSRDGWATGIGEQQVEEDDVIGFEQRVICGGGSVRWLQWNTRTMPERDCIYAVATDVTDRRRADAELREAHRMVEASRDELAASRARIVAATDQERRRVVRDLHDGAQQRLVHTVITLKLARDALQDEDAAAPGLMTEALDNAERAMAELRELAHGILPSVLTRGGLRAGVEELASRMPLPVGNGVAVGRLPAAVEATVYFVVAEALTNVAKHARAGHAEVTARIEDGTLAVDVRDDGVGGARPDGSGLVGLADRLAALDGQLRVESPADGGTLIAASIPLAGSAPELGR